MSTEQERALWRRRAAWLTQLGLDEGEYAPVEVLQEVAEATLRLLDEVDRLERERAEALLFEQAGTANSDAAH